MKTRDITHNFEKDKLVCCSGHQISGDENGFGSFDFILSTSATS